MKACDALKVAALEAILALLEGQDLDEGLPRKIRGLGPWAMPFPPFRGLHPRSWPSSKAKIASRAATFLHFNSRRLLARNRSLQSSHVVCCVRKTCA